MAIVTPEDLGARVRELREGRGLTREKVAELTGLATDTVRRIALGYYEIEQLARLGHWTHDFVFGRTRVSAQLCDILRIDPDAELDLRACAPGIHPDDRGRYEDFVAALMLGHDAAPIDVRDGDGDGEVRRLRCRGRVWRSDDGQPRVARAVVLVLELDDTSNVGRVDALARANELAAARAGPGPQPSRRQPLTPRQLEVLRLLGGGQTMKEIGATLGVSPRTVAFHKYRIMEVLGVRTNAELLLHSLSRGLIRQ
ncbi:LuxR C-terminal-related transcriptional regulator [Enhygromyxa salina]|uniref:Transcriptional regulatory protein UhpA n=1 Tax=Enhygromyxa salina TaxID=215803 RepID=A0A2S9XL72_9BACT|nr:LuxR C-terminal-related transcriptional regulator [Enhygromyxa salina]PRP93587.1 Transcriptional regulatory protein UhpA [Enhygromyxa salina]